MMRPSDLQVEHKAIDVNGVRLTYAEKGRGPLVVLLHGFPETWWSWRYQIDPLVEAGYRVVAPNQRGYGKSSKHGPYDLDTLAGDIAALVRGLGESRAIIVGHDWGGVVAWHFAATHPEMCSRLVVMNAPHPEIFRRAMTTLRWAQIRRSWYIFFFLLPRIPEYALTRDHASFVVRAFKSNAVDRANFGREEVAPIAEAMLEPGAARGMLGWYRTAAGDIVKNLRVKREYPLIHTPTRLIWGMSDLALGYEDCVVGTEAWVPGLTIDRVERCGHFVQSERPEAVNAHLLAFLREGREVSLDA